MCTSENSDRVALFRLRKLFAEFLSTRGGPTHIDSFPVPLP